MAPLCLAALFLWGGWSTPAAAQTPTAETYINSAENRARNSDFNGALKDLTQAIALDPKNADVYRYRGLLRIRTGDHAQAIADFTQAIALDGKKAENYLYRSSAKRQSGDADGAIADALRAVALNPKLEAAHSTLFMTYLDRAYRDTSLTLAQKHAFIAHGLDATNAAIRQIPSSIEARMYKALFLRMQAAAETDLAKQKALMAQASEVESHARELLNRPASDLPAGGVPAHPFLELPPPPPAPPPPPPPPAALSRPPVRIGPGIATPRKTKDVPPVYPKAAIASRVQGRVVIEAVIDERGHVSETRILQSIPLLDNAALDAVRQWEYTPTIVNGIPVAVIMTVTVTFNLK